MASKQYNSPMAMYSEDIIEEIMTQVHLSPKSQTLGQLDRCDTGIKSISDSDRDPYKSSRHPSLNQSAQK